MITKLIDVGQLFPYATTVDGAATGLTWYRPQRSHYAGDQVFIDQYTDASAYNSSGPNSVSLVISSQDRFGDVNQYLAYPGALPTNYTQLASYSTALSVNGTEVSDKGIALLSQQASSMLGSFLADNGAAFWVQASNGQPAGTFDIKFQAFQYFPAVMVKDAGGPATFMSGAPVTLVSNIANFNTLDYDWITAADPANAKLVIGYSTRAAGAATQDVYYQAFNASGTAIGPLTQVASGMRANGAVTMTDDGTNFYFLREVVSGGVASVLASAFTPATGALATIGTISSDFARILNISAFSQGDGTYDVVVEGRTAAGQHAFYVYQADSTFNATTPSATIALSDSGNARQGIQRVSGANGELVLAYTDAGQVHIVLFNAAGAQVDDYIVPGLTNFDRIRSMGQGQFELMWRETVSGSENVSKGAIFDIATAGRNVNLSGSTSTQWILGSHLADTIVTGSANDVIKGYGGNDSIDGGAGVDEADYTGNRSDYTLTKNLDGSWTVADNRAGSPDGTDTLRNVEQVGFADGKALLIQAQAVELQKFGALYTAGGAAISGEVWSRSHRATWNGDPVWISTFSPAAGYVSGGPNPYTLVVSPQDRFGDTGDAVTVASYTSGKTVNGVEVDTKGITFYQQPTANGPIYGIIHWLQPSLGQPAGTFDIKFQSIIYKPGNLASNTGLPAIELSGAAGTIFANITDFQSLDWNALGDGTLVLGYSTRAAGASTQDVWYQGVNPSNGAGIGPLTKVATLASDAAFAMSGYGATYTFISEDNSGSVAGVKFQSFDPLTGGLGTAYSTTISTGELSDIITLTDTTTSSGSRLLVLEGKQVGTGDHVLQFIGFPNIDFAYDQSTLIHLSSGANLARVQVQTLQNGLVIVGYTDGSQVHMSLVDPFGNLVSDTIVPGISNFDRLRALGQNQFEIVWREGVSGSENVVKSAIYSANEGARFVDQSGATTPVWLLGSQFSDTLKGGSGNDIFKGYGGNDLINGGAGIDEVDYTGARADYSIVRNPDGSYTVMDNRAGSPDGTDTLIGIEKLQFRDGLMRLGAAVATDINGDGKSDILFHAASGAEAAWQISDTTIGAGGTLGNAGAAWTRVASGDFNGDGKSDILFRKADGTLSTWTLSGVTISGGATLGNPGSNWSVAGVGDFDGNGTSDILFRADNGSYATWRLSGGAISGGATLGNPGAGWVFRATGDFNGDGKSDILFQSTSSGAYATWLVNGDALAGGATLGNPGAGWVFRSIGDFNGDGTSDILFQNMSSGAYASWNIVNDAVQGGGTIGTPGTAWTLRDTGDYNGDGKTDLLFQNRNGQLSTWNISNTSIVGGGTIGNPGASNTVFGSVKTTQPLAPTILFQKADGTVASWGMTGTTISSGATFGSSGSNWVAVAKADFNGDGKMDVLFRDSSGNLATWQTNGTAIVAGGGTIGNPGSGFAYKGVGDFDGDGRSDILFQNTVTGAYATWDIAGTSIVGGGTLGNPGGTWSQVGIGDFDGDGRSDILFKDTSGKLATWSLGNTSIVGGGNLGSPGNDWAYVGLGDFNGDGKSDLLFQKTDGTLATWNLSGTTLVGGGTIGNAGPNWVFQGIQDLNGDGKSDILFHSAGGTNLSAWLMNNTTIASGGTIGDPGALWRLVG